MDIPEGLAYRGSAVSTGDFASVEPSTRDFLTGTSYGSDLTDSYYSWLHDDELGELDGKFLTLGVNPIPTGGHHVALNPAYADNGSGGMPTYNPQPGLYGLPSPSSSTSFPIFPGTGAVPKQNQSITVGQPQGIHQLQPSPDTSSFGQLPGAANSFRRSQNSHVSAPVRNRSTQDHPPLNIDVNRTRSQLLPSFLVPPPVQSKASQATQGRVDPSQAQSRQAVPASPNLAHTTPFLVPPPVHFSQVTQGRVDPSQARSRQAVPVSPNLAHITTSVLVPPPHRFSRATQGRVHPSRAYSRQAVPASPNLAHTTSLSVPPQAAQGRVDPSQPHSRQAVQASPNLAHTASFLVPPPVQSEASQATQGRIDPSQPHSRQAAPASPNLARTEWAVHPWSQSPRPVPSQAKKDADVVQRSSTAPTLQQRIDLKVAALLAQQIASSKSPLPPAPSSTIQIQRKGDSHELVGHNCYFCKRDLSYPPEGPIVEDPTKLQEAAVLACGHSFHNFCLHRITPAEMASEPPCIPCAVGEE